jgi:ubiquinone/menaquinone biosynthesis C-methylase UbiE
LNKNENPWLVSQQYWDQIAPHFDLEPDHGLIDREVRQAWKQLLANLLPLTHGNILDIGCGTGSLSLILAELGHRVMGIDLSPKMIFLAKKKAEAAGADITFLVQEASALFGSPKPTFDALVCRHLLWVFPDIPQVLVHWVKLLHPGGHLLLIEGFWENESGLRAEEVRPMLPASLTNIRRHDLSKNPAFWGKTVDDERYAFTAVKKINKTAED